MSETDSIAPLEEQRICVICGFCCDGTLFLNAGLNPGERGHLPEKIEEASFTDGRKEYFRLPCKYFNKKCTIYDLKRADVCSSYRCQVLKDFSAGKVNLQEALDTVSGALSMRTAIIGEYLNFAAGDTAITFRQLLIELGKTQKDPSEKGAVGADFEVLLARCNIFEALLIKHFRSAGDFDKMMVNG
jgi:hypothetical protein